MSKAGSKRRRGRLTPRGKALRRAYRTRGITEQPARSNCDRRRDGIRRWQIRCANGARWLLNQPWCGVRCHDLLRVAGVRGLGPYLASVDAIEVYARRGLGCFRGWTTNPHNVLRGDLVVLFGRGVHVGLVRKVVKNRRGHVLYVITEEGNTSSGAGGSQDNGGGCYRRKRTMNEIYGFACVDYPDR